MGWSQLQSKLKYNLNTKQNLTLSLEEDHLMIWNVNECLEITTGEANLLLNTVCILLSLVSFFLWDGIKAKGLHLVNIKNSKFYLNFSSQNKFRLISIKVILI